MQPPELADLSQLDLENIACHWENITLTIKDNFPQYEMSWDAIPVYTLDDLETPVLPIYQIAESRDFTDWRPVSEEIILPPAQQGTPVKVRVSLLKTRARMNYRAVGRLP